MKDVLCFLNELDFVDRLDNDCFEKMVEVEKVMVRKLEDFNLSKMIHALNIFEEMKVLIVTNDLDYRLERIEPSRSVIFYLISFKHVVATNNKQVDE